MVYFYTSPQIPPEPFVGCSDYILKYLGNLLYVPLMRFYHFGAAGVYHFGRSKVTKLMDHEHQSNPLPNVMWRFKQYHHS